MSREQISIRTKDGICPAHVLRPDGEGKWPAVIFFMDGLGIRPALVDMAERLARYGYVVLLPDMYYRAGHYEPMDPKALAATAGGVLKAIAHLYSSTNPRLSGEDTAHFLSYLDTRSDVAGKKVGTTGYCMGGAMSLTAAGTYPDRVAAAASFHGGRLASDSPMSPHLLAPKMLAFVYVAAAVNDEYYPPEMAERFERTLTEARVPHRCETYAGALHGWTMTDSPIYNHEAAERHWRELTDLYKRTLH